MVYSALYVSAFSYLSLRRPSKIHLAGTTLCVECQFESQSWGVDLHVNNKCLAHSQFQKGGDLFVD